jgi:hypothetical protein
MDSIVPEDSRDAQRLGLDDTTIHQERDELDIMFDEVVTDLKAPILSQI